MTMFLIFEYFTSTDRNKLCIRRKKNTSILHELKVQNVCSDIVADYFDLSHYALLFP